ncbi:hypothetical protein GCM10027176_71280 [Actinoallomurus bryophytorum]|uniref:Alpha-tubulin suppressor-like RCC1 family protein n=1 Tax=Actinoallomurus bryophytorum TaxID=1490222 RepID=A0A543CUP2_9ACTN|nr:RCC1 domain-containing protein [Actinoallomurus bryophytorum]TQM00813.1 alpha-tubulin suppressor-like RCC1 family protein [Actinoallomurus bryophytorum]
MSEIVSAWGDNSNGQIGGEDGAYARSPVPVKGLEGVKKIDAGSGHVVALLTDGTAYAWGRNAFGQIGDGTTENQARPSRVKLDGIRDVAAGGGQTLFLMEDGTVWGSGAGFFGVLGATNPGLRPVPAKIDGLSEVRVLATGGGQGLAVLEDGSAWSWGRDDFGQLGDGDLTGKRPGAETQHHAGRAYPARLAPAVIPGLESGVRSVVGGGGHSVAVLDDGTVYAWGCNDRGQLGDGTWTHRSSPVKVAGLSGVLEVAAAYHHMVALLEDGTVRSWGINDRGQLGDGTNTHRSLPVEVKGLDRIIAVVAAGGGGEANPGDYGHSLALREDGTVWTWGCNDHGELGDGTTNDHLVPEQVEGLSGVRQVTGGGEVPAFRENPGGGFTLAVHQA